MERVETSNNVSNSDITHVLQPLPRRHNHVPVDQHIRPPPQTNDDHGGSSNKAHHSHRTNGGGTQDNYKQGGLDAPRHHDNQRGNRKHGGMGRQETPAHEREEENETTETNKNEKGNMQRSHHGNGGKVRSSNQLPPV